LYSQEIDTVKLNSLLKQGEDLNSEAIIIYQGDSLVTETYFGIGDPNRLIETMSCTKSIVGLAIICLLDDGLIDSLQTPIYVYYPEWNIGQKKQVTINHLLTMTSGLNSEPFSGEVNDYIDLAVNSEMVYEPGERFEYNNKSMSLIVGIIKKITGKPMDIYIAERLFKPLDIDTFRWLQDSAGNPQGMSGCRLKPKDFIKIGLLLLNNGNYNGKQIISEKNISKLVEPSEENLRYGRLWWLEYEHCKLVIKEEFILELIRLGIAQKTIDQISKIVELYLTDDYNPKLDVDSFQRFYKYHKEIEFIFRKLAAKLKPNSLVEIFENVAPENRFTKTLYLGEIDGFVASGSFGNYIVVDPSTKIVALRVYGDLSILHKMTRTDSSQKKYKRNEEHFFDFIKLVFDLTTTE